MTRRLLAAYDAWEEVDGEPQIVGYSIAWEEDGKQYKTEYKGLTFDLERLDAPEPILPEHLTTPWVESYLEAPHPLPPDTFLKSKDAIRYEPSNPTLLSELTRKEIEIYMKLVHSPHPNICPFYGCVRQGQQVTALALKQIPLEFPYICKDAGIMVPKLNLLRGLKRGLDHLHNLGIIHNDIKTTNVRLDDSLQPVIIDFDSALPEGEPMISAGTPGWLCSSKVSSKSNDLFGLGMFAKWLDGWEIDPFEDLDAYTTSPWTEDYLAPKIMVVSASSGLLNDILARTIISGAHLTVLNDTAQSNSLGIPSHLLNESIVFTPAQSREQFEQAWIMACSGLRSDEVDVVFFPISSDIISENSDELPQLRVLLSTLPQNLRHARMQPSIVLVDSNSSLSTPLARQRLEEALKKLVQDVWMADIGMPKVSEDTIGVTSDPTAIFSNLVLVHPDRDGGSSWNRLRVCFWQTSEPAERAFSHKSYLVAPNDLIDFVLDPPSEREPLY